MRTVQYVIPLLGALCLAPGCSDDPDSLTGGRWTSGDPSAQDDGVDDPPARPSEPAPSTNVTFGERTLARARLWIDANMPYCGGPNGGKDVICGGTCVRDGESKKAEWDKYRSDCSGFVSWSWELPAPGRTTSTFAPYDTTVSALISVSELAPGDALNNKGHVMLWGGWVDEAAGKALILQESRCGQTAHEKAATFEKIDATTLRISDGRDFRSIRYKNAR
jgi:hypothetical protein